MRKLFFWFFRKQEKNIFEILAHTAGAEGAWSPKNF